MAPSHIALVPGEGVVPLDELMAVAAALQRQASTDLAPAWGVEATVSPFAAFEDVPGDYWPLIVLEEDSVAAGSGVHQDRLGRPIGFVEVGPSWSLSASHECLEMLVDPQGNLMRWGVSPEDPGVGVELLVEVCDPVQSPSSAHEVDGVLVSDFVTPDYFGAPPGSPGPFSLRGGVTSPLEVLPEGCLTWRESGSGRWRQLRVDAAGVPEFMDLPGSPLASANMRGGVDALSPSKTWLSRHAGHKAHERATRVAAATKACAARAAEWREILRRLKRDGAGRDAC